MKKFLAAITAVNVVDTASTLWLVDQIGWGYEGNPFIRWCFQRLGVWPATAIKIGGALVLATGLWLTCREASKVWGARVWLLPWSLFLGFTFVMAFNVGGVIALWGI